MGLKLYKSNPYKEDGHEEFSFKCKGCGHTHSFVTAWGGSRKAYMEKHNFGTPTWTFNGDLQKPTFSPSLLCRATKPITDDEHTRIMAGEKIEPKKTVCHLFLRDGVVEYLSDCTHHLAGKTVPLEDIND